MFIVHVVLASLLSGEQVSLGYWPRVYEHHEEGKEVELYAMDLNGQVCTIATRGPGGGWTIPTSQRGEEHFAKYYASLEQPSTCPEDKPE